MGIPVKKFSFTKKATSIPPQPYFSTAINQQVTITYACIKALKAAMKSPSPQIHYNYFHSSFYTYNSDLKIGQPKKVWNELREKTEAELNAIIKQKPIKAEHKR